MGESTRRGTMEQPMSVEQIVRRAGTSDFDSQYTLKQWFRTAQVMLKQANIYEHEGNDQEAYSLLFRYSRLVLEDLPQHPDAKDPQYRAAWTDARKSLQRSLVKLELLKPRINSRYEQYNERLKARVARKKEQTSRTKDASLSRELRRLSLDSASHSEDEHEGSGVATVRIDPAEHKDMAVHLANKEIRRRIRGVTRRSADLDHGREDLSANLVDVRRQLDRGARAESPNNNTQAKREYQTSLAYNYPSIPLQGASKPAVPPLSPSKPGQAPQRPPKAPAPPPKSLDTLNDNFSQQPPIPGKFALTSSKSPSPTFSPTTSTPPLTPPEPQFAYSAYLENGSPLRTIFLPSDLRQKFLSIASPNTRLNRETMGLLCGTLIRNALFISKLVIPQQHSTSDTCEMEDEEGLLEYCEAQPEGLWTLGWIHTHPTQTCFMSSRDLHTHMGYQRTLLEAIAIVCAPTKTPDWGIFRLTDPPGMGAIASCNQPGLFHPHEETRLYTDALGRPGHVIEHKGLDFEVVDLRRPR